MTEPDERPEWLEIVDHTADIGIRVWADDVKMLFERAAWAMFSLLTDMRRVQPRRTWRVSVEASDREALLVRWLSELNLMHQTRGALFSRFEVTECAEKRLRARMQGEAIGDRHRIHTEIKAVTFHDLAVGRVGDVWRAQVIFDV